MERKKVHVVQYGNWALAFNDEGQLLWWRELERLTTSLYELRE